MILSKILLLKYNNVNAKIYWWHFNIYWWYFIKEYYKNIMINILIYNDDVLIYNDNIKIFNYILFRFNIDIVYPEKFYILWGMETWFSGHSFVVKLI